MSRVKRWRSVAGLLAAALVSLAVMTVFAIELSDTQAKSKQDVESRMDERSVLAVALIDSVFQAALGQQSEDQQDYGARVVSSRTLDANRQRHPYLVLLDRTGKVLASSRGFTAQARANLRNSISLARVRSGLPYGLGNVRPYGRTGVINFGVTFPTRYGERFLLTGFLPRTLSPFLTGELRRIPGVRGSHGYVIDGDNTVLASTNPARPVGYRFTARAQIAALSRSSGDRGGYYYDQVRLQESSWRILLAAPNGPLFASVSGLRKWLPWLIFVAFVSVAAAALALAVRALRSAESDLGHANARLKAINRELEEANHVLAHDALHDHLTQLPNRALFTDRLEQLLDRSRRDPTVGCAVLFVDLDNFKFVNDSLSHAAGDHLLVAVAERFQEALRPGDTVARIGGDEFALLLGGVVGEQDARIVADRVRCALGHAIDIGDHKLFVRASIGISFSSPGISAADLLRNADIAMYHAKRQGKDGSAVFDDTMYRQVVNRLSRENELRQAVEQSLIGVHYQPIIDLATGRVRALEALARWPAGWPEVSPCEFIPIAEEAGLIGSLGSHVLHTACDAFAHWRRAGLVCDDAWLNVNISRRQLDDPRLPDEIMHAITASGIPAAALRLEITESTLMQQPERMQRIVSDVCAKGVALHLDDFGTEFSSLAALLQFPVTALKIDRSFITSAAGEKSGSDAIVRGTIALAHGLGLETIAEGIEDPLELYRLRALGCEHGQGYLFSRPLDQQQSESFLADWSPASLAVAGDPAVPA